MTNRGAVVSYSARAKPGPENVMPIDKSLKVKSGGIQNRNVLTRAERIEKLKELERWSEGSSVLGLPKVRVTKLALKKKKKAKAEEGAEGEVAAAGGAAPAAGAAAGAAKPAAGAAKPAAGAAAKPAAGAAKPAKK
ncbi:MAG TPA: small basic protein [Pirellulaceae bacterium]|nr:small basic protein [Pirellulaceae bacterium]